MVRFYAPCQGQDWRVELVVLEQARHEWICTQCPVRPLVGKCSIMSQTNSGEDVRRALETIPTSNCSAASAAFASLLLLLRFCCCFCCCYCLLVAPCVACAKENCEHFALPASAQPSIQRLCSKSSNRSGCGATCVMPHKGQSCLRPADGPNTRPGWR